MRPLVRQLLSRSATLSLVVVAAACSDLSNPTQPPAEQLFTTPTGLVTSNPPEIFSGAGDIASCSNNNDEATAKLLDNLPGKVFIIGGGRVGLQVAQRLEADPIAYQVKLLERHVTQCQVLAERLSHTLVLHGDATDVKVLQEEGIADMDAVVVVTNDEGTNLIAALLASYLAARRAVKGDGSFFHSFS